MKKKPEPQPEMARIIKDTRDGSKDTFMPLKEAKEHFENGRMVELINCHPGWRCFMWKVDE